MSSDVASRLAPPVALQYESTPVRRSDGVIALSRSRILRVLALIVSTILALHLALQLLPLDFFGSEILKNKVHIDAENSIPTFLAAALLTACGLISWWLASLERLPWPGWGFLALVFVGAGIDEVAAMHEELTVPIRSALGAGGWLRFTWVVAGAGIALTIALLFLRTFLALPPVVRGGLALGAGLFLLGSIGMELPGGQLKETLGVDSSAYVLVSTLEEALEFAGALVWFSVLSLRLQRVTSQPTLRVTA
ncbi:MAG TPA: hypothetical protein VF164_02285 [Trueperaceae bacterium]